jgi:conserved repeat domain
MEKRGFRTVAVIALCLSVLGLSIGFAALSQTLLVNGTGTVKGNTWDIKFTDLSTPTLVNGGLRGSAAIETAASISTGTTMTFDVSFVLPGDRVIYDFKVTNSGTIPAKITNVLLSGVSEALAKDVNYYFTYAGGTALAIGDTLAAGESKDLKLTVEFDQDADSLPATDVVLSLGATIVYGQQ